MKIKDIIVESSNMASAEQIWDYVGGIHPKDQQGGGFLKSLVMLNPQYELKRVPLSSLHIPNDEDDGNDPYGRAMHVDVDHAEEYSQYEVDKKPLVVDSQGHILDGAHRAWAASELLNKKDIMAYVPIKTRASTPQDLEIRKKFINQNVAEAFNQPYSLQWENGEFGDYDAYTKLPDGSNLSIMFNKEDDDVYAIEFWRNNSQDATGDGDSQKVFATVLSAIQEFLTTKEQPRFISFTGAKGEDGEGKDSRVSLYSKLLQRYATSWGYKLKNVVDRNDAVEFDLVRIKQDIEEVVNKELWHPERMFKQRVPIGDYEFEARESIGGMGDYDANALTIIAYDPKKKNKIIGNADFVVKGRGSKRSLVSDDTYVDPKYRGEGIATMMYAYAKSLGNDIKGSNIQTPMGKKMWANWDSDAKHLRGVAEDEELPEGLLGNMLPWPEVVNKINSAMKAMGWKEQRKDDGSFIFTTRGAVTDEYYIVIIDNRSDSMFTYALGTVEEGDPHIGEQDTLPTTEASVSKLMNAIRDGFGLNENFADGKNPGRKGLAKRSGVNTKASVSDLRNVAKHSSGEKQRMAHWLANMKAGRAKARRK